MGGDFISKHYSGTASVLTKITLKGHQNLYDKFEQKMISVKRFQKQAMTDDFKQECILILQGLSEESKSSSESEIFRKISMEQQFVVKNTIRLQAITFHVGCTMPTNHRDLLSLFMDKQSDVVIIGL